MNSQIYLDHNATTPLSPVVQEAMLQAASETVGNPASQHAAGRKARKLLEQARERIVELLGGKTTGMQADRLVFTSGGTEANHLALLGLAGEPWGRVIISAIEHPSVNGAAEELTRRGFEVVRWPVTKDGIVDVVAGEKLFAARVCLVSVMLANNETGVIQPLTEIVQLCRKLQPDVVIHSDAVQAVGKIPVDFRTPAWKAVGSAADGTRSVSATFLDSNIDALTIAPHKFHGPVGIGGLLVAESVKLQPTMFGGFQQGGLRPGTESVALAVGFQTALDAWHAAAEDRHVRMTLLRDALEAEILRGFSDAIVIGANSPRLPQTSNIAFPGVNRQALVMALDFAGVACSTGSACASGSSEPSPVLLAMRLPEEQISSSLRFSLGAFTTADEVAEAARRIVKETNRLRHAKTS